MGVPHTIRAIKDDEFDEAHDLVAEAFNEALDAQHRDRMRRRYEFGRSLAAFDADRMIGLTGAYSLRMTVPGGVRPVAGVTAVVVLPTHRRRGVLRTLMTRQLADIHEGGESVAALVASESAIYGRFGYGCASRQAAVTIRRGEGGFRDETPGDPGLRMRLGALQDLRTEMAVVYDAQVGTRPGMWARDGGWWDGRLVVDSGGGGGPLRCLVAESGGEPRGYALFQVTSAWSDFGIPDGQLRVREIIATDPAAYAALWRYLLDRDLVATVTSSNRPPDDPLLYLLSDPRRARVQVGDGLWVRLVDVGAALAQRAYARPVDLVIGVDDETCPWNARRWRLSGDLGGATCEPTRAPADVALAARELAALYLGGEGLAAPAAAGLVRELRPDASRTLSTAMSWDPKPWCPMGF